MHDCAILLPSVIIQSPSKDNYQYLERARKQVAFDDPALGGISKVMVF